MSNETIAREAAENFRQEHGLSDAPIENLTWFIENKLGVGVARVADAQPGHGMTMSDGHRCLIAASCTNNPMRLRSTLAHEIGHLKLESVNRYLTYDQWEERNSSEIQADAFARHFLLPLSAVKPMAFGKEVSEGLLSDLTQIYGVSSSIAAIQLREAGLIDQSTCTQWMKTPTATLAMRFGWHSDYNANAEESNTPRAPQKLLAQAIEAYRWGVGSVAAIARLTGQSNIEKIQSDLEATGIRPMEQRSFAASKPADSGERLTPKELAQLMGHN
ncbi:MAG: ImmA/IrrE family metallo-endopeptidase [Acidobacteriota bacterium]|nr:ImmA/IrrE family metallo-endopeptidase [Acidobacteriota bacterium]